MTAKGIAESYLSTAIGNNTPVQNAMVELLTDELNQFAKEQLEAVRGNINAALESNEAIRYKSKQYKWHKDGIKVAFDLSIKLINAQIKKL